MFSYISIRCILLLLLLLLNLSYIFNIAHMYTVYTQSKGPSGKSIFILLSEDKAAYILLS